MSRRLRLRLSAGSLRAELCLRSGIEWAAETPVSDPASLSAAIAELVAERPDIKRVMSVDVVIERPLVQLRTLADLPPVSGRALTALIELQAGRFFRKNGSPLVTDAAWIERRRWLGRQTPRSAVAAAIESPWLEAIVAATADAGLPVPCVGPASARGTRRLDLVPPAARARIYRNQRAAAFRLAILAASLWVAVGAGYVGRRVRLRSELISEAARLERPASAVASVRRAMHEGQLMIETIADEDARRGAALGRLVALVGALPDSAWLSSLDLQEGDAGMITGSAGHAADVVASLEKGGAVPNARLDGPPVAELVAGLRVERFSIKFGRGVAK